MICWGRERSENVQLFIITYQGLFQKSRRDFTIIE
jgi:hypothetical protein